MAKNKTWNGTFEVKNNLLFYKPGTGLSPDRNLKVEGKWNITKSGRLRFIVANSQNRVFGKTITVGTGLTRVNEASLEFKAAHRVTTAGKNIRIITISGKFIAMPGKKLAFELKREGKVDTLNLSGTWDVLENNQIGCLVKRACDGKGITNLVVLNGTWKIAGNILTYQAEKSNKPFFAREFGIKRVIYTDKRNGIDLSLGASLRQETIQRGKTDTISLRGAWKQEGTKVEFTLTSLKRQSLSFILSRKLSSDKELVFELDTSRDKKPSFTLTLSKKIKGDSSFFIRGKVSGEDKRAEAGFYFPF